MKAFASGGVSSLTARVNRIATCPLPSMSVGASKLPDAIAPVFENTTPGFPEAMVFSVETAAAVGCTGDHGPGEDHDHDGELVESRTVLYLDTAGRRITLTRLKDSHPGESPHLVDYADTTRGDRPVLLGVMPILSALLTEIAVLMRAVWPKGTS